MFQYLEILLAVQIGAFSALDILNKSLVQFPRATQSVISKQLSLQTGKYKKELGGIILTKLGPAWDVQE